MSKFEKIVNSAVAGQRLEEVKEQVEDVKNSSLTFEQKQEALKSHKRMVITTIIFVIIVLFISIISAVLWSELNTKFGNILSIISVISAPIILIVYALLLKKMFPDWAKHYELVNKGFDGLSEQEISLLKPNDNDKVIIKKQKTKIIIYSITFLLALVIDFTVLLNLGFAVYSPITIIVTVIIAVIWYVLDDTCRTEIHRIESGYYKKSVSYKCHNCNNEFKIQFKDIDKYNTIEKDKNGIRTVNCPSCNSPIALYNFDIDFRDYKKYLNQNK